MGRESLSALTERIIAALELGPSTAAQLAARLDEDVVDVRFALGRMLGRSVAKVGSSWRLLSRGDSLACLASCAAGLRQETA